MNPRDVFAQSFNLADVTYWITHEPAYGRQAVYLDDVDPSAGIPPLTAAELHAVRAQGVRIFAPPIPALLAVDSNDRVVPSQYANDIRAAGLKIISWSFERADLRRGAANAGFYYAFDPEGRAIKKDSDMGMFLLRYPRDKVNVFVWFVLILKTIEVPTFVFILAFLAFDIIGYRDSNEVGVNYIAHFSGFIAGALYKVAFWKTFTTESPAPKRTVRA